MSATRWCDVAELRRRQIESGVDVTFVDVFLPMFIDCIRRLNPKRVIEIGCGTGHLSKSLAKGNFSITAIEPSPGMHAVASDVLNGVNVDLIRCSSFEIPPRPTFDLAFSHLVAHVVNDLKGFLLSVASQLELGGYFMFSIPHPCFYNSYKGLFGDEYSYMAELNKMVTFTVTNDPDNPISGVPYHHRPLSIYINSIVEAGFALERFDEVLPPEDIQAKYGERWLVPRYCVFICKRTN